MEVEATKGEADNRVTLGTRDITKDLINADGQNAVFYKAFPCGLLKCGVIHENFFLGSIKRQKKFNICG